MIYKCKLKLDKIDIFLTSPFSLASTKQMDSQCAVRHGSITMDVLHLSVGARPCPHLFTMFLAMAGCLYVFICLMMLNESKRDRREKKVR